jgi:hypothetical protein
MAVNPGLRNFTLQRAADWNEEYILSSTQADGSIVPMDLTGFTIEAQAWDEEREFKYADFGVTATNDNRIIGKFFLTLTDVQTLNFPDELYYDVMLTNTNGLKEYYVEGKITVSQSYTR